MGRARRRRWWFMRTSLVLAVAGAVGLLGWEARAIVARRVTHLVTPAPERVPLGTWCAQDDCQFFDRAGAWGTALRSSGPLLLLVSDEQAGSSYDSKVAVGVLTAVDGLPALQVSARQVTLPEGQPGGAVISTDKGYDLYLDALGDVADQLRVLGIFLADKAKEPAFAPQYIDLRTPGRVYYR